ncbi:MAG: carboxypeptidase regulatory-like domain-containing protein [Deltaproteobacteria bacterium]|nr:carboxypeptidase regulatory-like domain-containing protein [Deltaproteobacteria bacterium]
MSIVWKINGLALVAVLAAALAGCSDRGRDGDGGGGDSDADTDTDTWDEWEGETGSIHGTVMAPAGTFPVAGALVYTSLTMPDAIPDTVHCEDCEDMTAKFWTLTNPDGTFELTGVPALSDWYLIVQKGLFRTVSEFPVGPGGNDAPLEVTTLPGENSGDGMKRIPNFAVAKNGWDLAEDMLAKLGMGEIDGSGHLQIGTETFDLFNDDSQAGPSYPDSAEIYASQDSMNSYHMIFMPCTAGHMKDTMLTTDEKKDMLRTYISAGGKLYGSCYGYDWVEEPFHEYITFIQDDPTTSIQPGLLSSTVGSYDTMGTINDEQMRDWLAVVNSASNLDSFPFMGAWVEAEHTNDVDDGHGLEDNNGTVMPITWVTDNQHKPGAPLTVTYDYDCGRIFFSAFQVVESSPSPQIRPQEFVLIYLMMEVGVCSGSFPVE